MNPALPARPTLTLQLPTAATYGRWLGEEWSRLLDIARAAEGAGVDRVAVVDHVVMGGHPEQYTWATMTVPQNSPWLEPLSVLTAIAAATSTLRLSTRILIAPLRPAALLAKSVATLDVLSGGRVDLGVGTGWQREEYEAQGLDFERRGRMLTDTVGACRALWTGTPVSYSSPTVAFEDVCCSPAPLQDRLPVWFGGTLHPRNLDRIAALGDGWIPIMRADLETVSAGVRALRAACGDDRTLTVQGELPIERRPDGSADLDATVAGAAAFLEAGATDIFMSVAAVSPDPDECLTTVAAIGDRFQGYR